MELVLRATQLATMMRQRDQTLVEVRIVLGERDQVVTRAESAERGT